MDLTVLHKNNRQLQRIKVKANYAYKNIPFNVLKSSVALFLAEVLNKCLKEEENRSLYCFLENSLIEFDRGEFDSQFHIRFLVGLSGYLGFSKYGKPKFSYFDLMNGCLVLILINANTTLQTLQILFWH